MRSWSQNLSKVFYLFQPANLTHFYLANQFILDDVREYLADGAIKYSIQCFDEVDNILKLSGKEDDVSAQYMKEARQIFTSNNLN